MKNQTTAKKHAPYIAFKRALAGLGLTYKDVAELLKCHEATIQMKINGTSDFFVSEQIAICETFGMDPSIFFDKTVA